MKTTIAILTALACASCSMSLGPDGKPVVGVDPVALAAAINAWQQKHGSKDATVVIVTPPVAPATAPTIQPVP